MPANFTNPKNIQAYFTALAPDARFDSIFAYIMSNFQESVKAVTREKVGGTTQNYAIYMTTLTVMKEQKLRLSLGDLRQNGEASTELRKEPKFANVKLFGCGLTPLRFISRDGCFCYVICNHCR